MVVLRNTTLAGTTLIRERKRALILENAILDTERARTEGEGLSIPEAFKAAPDTEHYMVQFDHPVSEIDRSALEAVGARISHYVPNAAYAVHLSPDRLEEVRGVRRCLPYRAVSSVLQSNGLRL